MIVETSIGNIAFNIEAMEGDISGAKIIEAEIEPSIPDGMAVERNIAVLFSVVSSVPIKALDFSCSWVKYNGKGDSCSGEGLDAWEWENDNQLVVIGTEDGDWLGSRLNLGSITRENYPVSIQNNCIHIEIEKYPENRELTLHFIISQNTLPEKVECSCWFAVDVVHSRVLEACR